jgi:hypothetical protein
MKGGELHFSQVSKNIQPLFPVFNLRSTLIPLKLKNINLSF